jgi:hypothetical protein
MYCEWMGISSVLPKKGKSGKAVWVIPFSIRDCRQIWREGRENRGATGVIENRIKGPGQERKRSGVYIYTSGTGTVADYK